MKNVSWLSTLVGVWFIWTGGILWGDGLPLLGGLIGALGTALVWFGWEPR